MIGKIRYLPEKTQRQTLDAGSSAHEGQILIVVAVASLILFAFAALAVDVGLALSERRGAQNAADAASMAVARAMAAGADQNELRQTAETYAELNGYEIEDPDNDIRFIDADTVEVEVSVDVPRVFLGAFYEGDWRVGTSAVATMTHVEEPFAMIALGEDAGCHPSTGIRFSGSNAVNVSGGSIGSNACIRVDGGSADILIDGNAEALHGINDGQDAIDVTDGHDKRTRTTPINDPLNHWNAPSCSTNGEVTEDPHWDSNGSAHILSPGRYSSFPGGNTRQLSLLPGIYCIEDNVTIGSQVIARSVDPDYESTGQVGAGGGVLMYVTGNNGRIRFNGQGSLQIKALSYYNPNFPGCTNACEENAAIWISESSCSDFDASGGSETFIHGVIYAPCSEVELGGNPTANVLEGMIIADRIHIHGNATMNLVANQDPIEARPEVYLIQ
jgi:hypothetical protein